MSHVWHDPHVVTDLQELHVSSEVQAIRRECAVIADLIEQWQPNPYPNEKSTP